MHVLRTLLAPVSFALALTASILGHAAERDVGILGLVVENDEIHGTDRHYTSGVRLSWTTGEGGVPDWMRSLARLLPGGDAPPIRAEYALGQSMFTPLNRFRSEPLSTDRPYAGWLYGTAAILTDGGDALDRLELTAGIVGPSALAKQTQRLVHRATGARFPKGWDHQIDDEPGIVLAYDRVWRNILPGAAAGLDLDIAPHAGLAFGNVLTYGAIGGTIRLGRHLDVDYGPQRVRPGSVGSGFFATGAGFGWYAFVGAEGRAVARNIFLDGNTFDDDPSVDRRPLVADLQAGLAFVFDGARIAYTHVLRTKEYDGQEKPDFFGALSLSFAF